MLIEEVASPCINLCKIDEPTQRCIGCDRSIDEITRWSTMDNDAKQSVINAVVRRKLERRQTALQNKELTPKHSDNSASSDRSNINGHTGTKDQQ